MTRPKARVWFMPAGSELLGTDGKQAFYGTEDGLGTVAAAGTVDLDTAVLKAGGAKISHHAMCCDCDRMVIPFADPGARDAWAAAHRSGTGHTVALVDEEGKP